MNVAVSAESTGNASLPFTSAFSGASVPAAGEVQQPLSFFRNLAKNPDGMATGVSEHTYPDPSRDGHYYRTGGPLRGDRTRRASIYGRNP